MKNFFKFATMVAFTVLLTGLPSCKPEPTPTPPPTPPEYDGYVVNTWYGGAYRGKYAAGAFPNAGENFMAIFHTDGLMNSKRDYIAEGLLIILDFTSDTAIDLLPNVGTYNVLTGAVPTFDPFTVTFGSDALRESSTVTVGSYIADITYNTDSAAYIEISYNVISGSVTISEIEGGYRIDGEVVGSTTDEIATAPEKTFKFRYEGMLVFTRASAPADI
ncbi:MAG: hypothetical protein LBS01_01800 [Prevotellaceae bacterium]|jgi:hypothetical protein|nr:hypothetical protein [Prevotellaceae bacterium]